MKAVFHHAFDEPWSARGPVTLVSQALFYNPNQIWNLGMYPMMKITTMSTGMP